MKKSASKSSGGEPLLTGTPGLWYSAGLFESTNVDILLIKLEFFVLRFFCRLIAIGILAFAAPTKVVRAQTQVRIPSQPRVLAQGNSIGGGVAPAPTAPANTAPGFGTPTLDPYATSPNAAASPPTLFGTSPRTAAPGAGFGATAQPLGSSPYNSAAPTPGWPGFSNPSAAPQPGFPNTGYPSTYGQQPAALFPNGVMPDCGPGSGWQWPQPAEGRYMRLFQDLRLKHTWLAGGDDSAEVGVNETEIGTTVNFPNFLWSNVPIHVSPVFVMDWWNGPEVGRLCRVFKLRLATANHTSALR
jgi:hypothetical protein